MEKVNRQNDLRRYNALTFWNGIVRVTLVLVSIAAVVAGMISIFYFIAKVL